MATSISYSSTAAGGKTLSKSVTDINPNLSNEVAKTFTQKLNALTTNTLNGINRIDKTEIDPDIVYSTVEAYYTGSTSLPSTVTIDGFTVNIDNKSIAEEVDFEIAFRIKDVANSEFTFNEMTVKNTVGTGIYAGYSAADISSTGIRSRTQIEFYYFANQTGAAATTTFTIPGGSTTVGGTTYYYAPFTLTVNQLGQ